MVVTLSVFKDDKSITFNDEQFSNIEFMVVTLSILKDDKFNSFNDEQL